MSAKFDRQKQITHSGPSLMRQMRRLRTAALISTALAGWSTPTLAQTIPAIPGPPVFSSVDEHEVNVADGTFRPRKVLAEIGPEGTKLAHVFPGRFDETAIAGVINSSSGQICGGGGCTPATFYKVSIDGESYIFAKPTMGNPNGIITTAYFNSKGQSLSYNSTTQIYTHTDRVGTVNTYSKALAGTVGWTATEAVLTSRTFKSGEVLTYSYSSCGSFCNRLNSVLSSKGYMLKYDYTGAALNLGSRYIASVTAIDTSVDYCDPGPAVCTYTRNWPHSTIVYTPSGGSTTMTVTDELSRTTTFTFNSSTESFTGVTSPQGVAKSVGYDANGKVSSVVDHGVTWSYSYGSDSFGSFTKVTGPDTLYTKFTTDASGNVLRIQDRAGNTTSRTLDPYGFVSQYYKPEGNSERYVRDGGGNVTEYRMYAKSGSGLADIVINETFCTTGGFLCNKPLTHTDAKGQVTNFAYDSQTGNLTTVTYPAATTGGVRPESRFGYSLIPTYAKNSSGALVQAGSIWALSSKSECTTLASCAGTADERKTVYSYSGSNHVQPTSITVQSGDGALSSAQAFTYSELGSVATVDGPLAGTGDTTRYRYDAAGQLVGAISPDPDGTDSRTPSATRLSYNADGLVTLKEAGTVVDQSDSAWANFTSTQQQVITFDSADRPVKSVVTAGGTTYSVSQQSYDPLNRPDCSAVRMDPAQWSAQTDACTPQTNGPNGPDRVTRPTYDSVGRVVAATTSYGTVDADTESTTYTNNGLVATIKDGESNLTTNEYDGHDRLVKTRYPVATQGANTSSTTDYEQLTYDANSNVTQRRLRDAGTIDFAYDNLNRTTTITPSGEYAVTLQYDLSGHVTQMQRSGDSQTLTQTYDALGRLTAQTQPYGSAGYQFDVAGRLTRLTWPDGLYVNYDYDTAGNVTAIRENGVTSGIGVLATYSYDSLGNRTGITRGNGTTTSYAFDPLSRLSSTTQDLAGTTSDQTIGSIAYNPASQIQSQVKSNDAYAWTGHYNVNRNYTVNGLNQQTAAGATTLGYDARGNLTTSGSTTYTYNKLNQLTGTTGVTLTYDPAGRLDQIAGGSGTTRFAYAGSAMIGEYSTTGTLLRRYVPGPGTDEPVIWYEGSGTADRRWLHADERGSVIAISDGSGAMLNINRYDEYGIPQCPLVGGAPDCSAPGANVGRFQYTGQMWLPELGMYNYKARMYSPTLGRFMQTDPIGYGDGVNWYNYVGSDPVNFADPSGMVVNCFTIYKPSSTTVGNFPPAMLPSITCADDGVRFDFGVGGGGSYFPPPLTPPVAPILPRVDPCHAQATGANVPSGFKPYKVDAFSVMGSILSHALARHGYYRSGYSAKSMFNKKYSNPALLLDTIGGVVMTNPTPSRGGTLRYTVNLGQDVGFDSVNGGDTTYITVIMGPKVNGYRGLVTAYPGCP